VSGGASVTTIAVLGLGEAGSAIGGDAAAAGARVRGFDPVRAAPEGVEPARDSTSAATGADVVVSLNSAAVALEVVETVAPVLEPGRLFADLNTAAPALKRAAAAIVERRGAAFADVALLRGVPDWGIRTPSLVSGTGAETFAQVFARLGMAVTQVGAAAGERLGFEDGCGATSRPRARPPTPACCTGWSREAACTRCVGWRRRPPRSRCWRSSASSRAARPPARRGFAR
jgi:hypothetical protein